MPKPEWGTKRTCPQTGERFYDLGNDNPVTSPNGHQWYPEPVLKSKQPIPFEEDEKKKDVEADSDLGGDDDLEDIGDIDEENNTPDADVDLGGDEDLGVAKGKGDDEDDDN